MYVLTFCAFYPRTFDKLKKEIAVPKDIEQYAHPFVFKHKDDLKSRKCLAFVIATEQISTITNRIMPKQWGEMCEIMLYAQSETVMQAVTSLEGWKIRKSRLPFTQTNAAQQIGILFKSVTPDNIYTKSLTVVRG